MTVNSNPLQKYFRQPVIYLKLPSSGEFYPPGTLDMPPNGELPVYPMTAVDEIMARTPDALFNGSAIVNIVKSCMPNIIDPWQLPQCDFNSVLSAIKLASYGHDMEVPTICPKCEQREELTIDLRVVIDHLKAPNYNDPLTIGDLTFYFKPLTYSQLNEANQMQFEDQKILNILSSINAPDEEKLNQLGQSFRKVTQLTIASIAQSVSAVKTTDAMVTDLDHIHEFLVNCPKNIFESVRDHIIDLRSQTDLQPIQVKCPSCSHEYKQEFILDISNFFATAS